MPRILSRVDLVPKNKKPWYARTSSSPGTTVVGSRSVIMSRDATETCRHEGISYRIVSEESLKSNLTVLSTPVPSVCSSEATSVSSDLPQHKHRREPSDDWGYFVDFSSNENPKVVVEDDDDDDEPIQHVLQDEFSDQVGLMGFEPPLKKRA